MAFIYCRKSSLRKIWAFLILFLIVLLIFPLTGANNHKLLNENNTLEDSIGDHDFVVIGDERTPEFENSVKFRRWDNDTYLRIGYSGDENFGAPVIQGNKTTSGNSKESVNLYKIENNKFEFEIVLDKKPNKNTWVFEMERWEDFIFYYQNQSRHPEMNDEVHGGYAVYYNHNNPNKYGTGKAFQIYRPKVTDKTGNWTWAEFSLDNGNLTLTIDIDWLNNAVYPVIIDPTLGYTSIGTVPISFAVGTVYCPYPSGSGLLNMTETGTSQAVTIALNVSAIGPLEIRGAVYNDTNGDGDLDNITDKGVSYNREQLPSTNGWMTLDLNQSGNLYKNINYTACVTGNNTINTWFDDGVSSDVVKGDTETYPSIFDPFNDGQTNSWVKISIFINYTVADTKAPNITIQSPSNITYNLTAVVLSVTADETITAWNFSNNTQSNVVFNNNMTLNVTQGSNNYTICGSDGTFMNCSRLVFAIETLRSPNITILTPSNTTYNLTSIPFQVTADKAVTWNFSSNIQSNIVFNNNMTLNITGGSNQLTVCGTAGTFMNCSRLVFTVSISSIPGIMAFIRGGTNPPAYLFYNTSTNQFNLTGYNATKTSSSLENVWLKCAPNRYECALATADTVDDLHIQFYSYLSNGTLCWNNGTECGRVHNLTTTLVAASGEKASLEYENSTGDLIMVWANNSEDGVMYERWNGTHFAFGAVDPVNPDPKANQLILSTLNTTGTPTWIQTAQEPGTDNISIIYSTDLSRMGVLMWTGSSNSWGCELLYHTDPKMSLVAAETSSKIDIVHEMISGDTLALIGNGSFTNIYYFVKPKGSCTYSGLGNFSTSKNRQADTIIAFPVWGTDRIGIITQDKSANGVEWLQWNGTNFSENSPVGSSAGQTPGNQLVSGGCVRGSDKCIVAYASTDATDITGSSLVPSTDTWTNMPNFATNMTTNEEAIQCYSYPEEVGADDKVLCIFEDDENDLWAYTYDNSLNNWTATNQTPGAFETSTFMTEFRSFAFDFITVDTTAPTITIQSPTNTTYNLTGVVLSVTANEAITAWNFSNNTQSNIVFNNNMTLNVTQGSNNYTVCGSDGTNMNCSRLVFAVETARSPNITIQSPTNTTYNLTAVVLSVTADKAVTWNFSNNTQSNIVFNNNMTLNVTQGSNNYTICGTAGTNMNCSRLVFAVDSTMSNLNISTLNSTQPIFANYTEIHAWYNDSSGAAISGANTSCTFQHNITGNLSKAMNLSYNASNGRYNIIADGGYLGNHTANLPVGNYTYNITCKNHNGTYKNQSRRETLVIGNYSTSILVVNDSGVTLGNPVKFTANYTKPDGYRIQGLNNEIGRIIWNSTDIDTGGATGSTAFFDQDNDGKKDEIVVGVSQWDQGLRAFYSNGTEILTNGWPGDEPVSTINRIAIGDLDNDGFENDIVAVSNEKVLRVFNESGWEVWSYSISDAGRIISAVIGDLDNDGKKDDIAVGTDDNTTVYVFNTSNGTTWQHLWNYTIIPLTGDYGVLDMGIGDLDRDGNEDDVVAQTYGTLVNVTAFNESGNIIFTTLDMGGYSASLSVTDLDNDGYKDEVLVGEQGDLWAFKWDGTMGAVYSSTSGYHFVQTDPVSYLWSMDVGDLDNDGIENDIVAGDDSAHIWGFDNATQSFDFTEPAGRVYAIKISDINGDGENEIAAGGLNDILWVLDKNGTLLWSYFLNQGNIGGGGFDSSVININDINNDGIKDIAVSSENGFLHVFDSMPNCTIKFNSTANYNMSWNITSKKWDYDMIFGSAVEHNYNLTCSKNGYTEQVFNGNVTITVSDTKAPNITILSPSNTTYNLTGVVLSWTADETITSMNFSNNTQSNIVFTGNYTLNVTQGSNNYTICGSDGTFMNCSRLVFTVETARSPNITIQSPTNTTYNLTAVVLSVTADKAVTWNFSNNTQSNILFNSNMTLNTTQGSNNYTICGTAGTNMNCSRLVFAVDSVAPTITIQSPTNTTYNLTAVVLSVTASEAITTWNFSNNTQSNIVFNNNMTLNVTQGSNNYTICGSDGTNMNCSRLVFSVDTTTPFIAFVTGTESNDTYMNRTAVNSTVNINDANEKNATFTLYNSSGLVNSTLNSTPAQRSVNWTHIDGGGLKEGAYSYNVTTCDLSNLCNSTETRTITLDRTPPTVTLTSPSSGSTKTSASVTFTYSADDIALTNCSLIVDNSIVQTNSSPSIGSNTFTRTLSSAAHTWNINCTDKINSTATNTSISFTVSVASTTTSSPSSSTESTSRGGSESVSISEKTPSNVQSSSISRSYFNIPKDTPIIIPTSIEFKRATGLKEVYLMTNREINDVQIKIKSVAREDIAEIPDYAYKYFSIESLNFEDKDVKESEIRIEVEKELFEKNNYDIDDVKIERYVNNEWVNLETSLTQELLESYIFSAKTQGFENYSMYTLTLSSANKIAGEVIEEEEIRPGIPIKEKIDMTINESRNLIILGASLLILVIIIAIVLIYLTFASHKKYKRNREF